MTRQSEATPDPMVESTAESTAQLAAVSTAESTARLTMHKSERLHHRSLVEALFRSGGSLYDYPLRLVWRAVDADTLAAGFRDTTPPGIAALQMMVTIPKKKRRHAIDRVLMRRRIREAYRRMRLPLRRYVSESDTIRTLSIAIIYQASENLSQVEIDLRIGKLLEKLLRKCQKLNEKE